MTALYAVVLVVAIVALVLWLIAAVVASSDEASSGVASSNEGRSALDPEVRFGRTGRVGIAAAVGFGMGGMSATFAGWEALPALAAAVAAAVLGAVIGHFLGPTEDEAT